MVNSPSNTQPSKSPPPTLSSMASHLRGHAATKLYQSVALHLLTLSTANRSTHCHVFSHHFRVSLLRGRSRLPSVLQSLQRGTPPVLPASSRLRLEKSDHHLLRVSRSGVICNKKRWGVAGRGTQSIFKPDVCFLTSEQPLRYGVGSPDNGREWDKGDCNDRYN